jgi:hypothetical protein
MALVERGRVYIIFTTLTRPKPKEKIVLCVCENEELFVWFNTHAQPHGVGQLQCTRSDHPALTHDCYLDLSRVTTFRAAEIANAQPRAPIPDELKKKICSMVRAGIPTLAPRYTKLILENFA